MHGQILENLKLFARDRIYPWNEQLIDRAFKIAEEAHKGQLRASSRPYITHPVEVAFILARLQCDIDTFIASILHDVVEDSDVPLSIIEQLCNQNIANLVAALTKVQNTSLDHKQRKDETVRKLLVAMAQNPRVIYLKLADRLHNMRTIESMTVEQKQRIARETLEIYVPLADTVGISYLRNELELASLRILKPEIYTTLEIYRKDHANIDLEHLTQVESLLDSKLQNSITRTLVPVLWWTKPTFLTLYHDLIIDKDIDISDVQNASSKLHVKVRTNHIDDCYKVLEVIHSLWSPVTYRFTDYTFTPKPNGLRAIQTVVIGPNTRQVEFCIATYEMHKLAECGPLTRVDQHNVSNLQLNYISAILSKILYLDQLFIETSEFITSVKSDVLAPQIRVHTNDGRVEWLPLGSTPIDLAYRLGDSSGHRCRRARIDGKKIPLSQRLMEGNVVTIEGSSAELGPQPEWESFAATYIARSKISQWFKK